jgi:hypothetical protein
MLGFYEFTKGVILNQVGGAPALKTKLPIIVEAFSLRRFVIFATEIPFGRSAIKASFFCRGRRPGWGAPAPLPLSARDGRKLLFQRQIISRPKVRLAGFVEDNNRSITIELDFEYPVRRVEKLFYPVRHHGRHKLRNFLLYHAEPKISRRLRAESEQ